MCSRSALAGGSLISGPGSGVAPRPISGSRLGFPFLRLVGSRVLEPLELFGQAAAFFIACGLERPALLLGAAIFGAAIFGGLAFLCEAPLLGVLGVALLLCAPCLFDLVLCLGLDLRGPPIGFGGNAPLLGLLGAAFLVGAARLLDPALLLGLSFFCGTLFRFDDLAALVGLECKTLPFGETCCLGPAFGLGLSFLFAPLGFGHEALFLGLLGEPLLFGVAGSLCLALGLGFLLLLCASLGFCGEALLLGLLGNTLLFSAARCLGLPLLFHASLLDFRREALFLGFLGETLLLGLACRLGLGLLLLFHASLLGFRRKAFLLGFLGSALIFGAALGLRLLRLPGAPLLVRGRALLVDLLGDTIFQRLLCRGIRFLGRALLLLRDEFLELDPLCLVGLTLGLLGGALLLGPALLGFAARLLEHFGFLCLAPLCGCRLAPGVGDLFLAGLVGVGELLGESVRRFVVG